MKEGFSEILYKAIDGDSKAFETIVEIYQALIDAHCFFNGKLDEDCRQYIEMRLFLDLKTFGKLLSSE